MGKYEHIKVGVRYDTGFVGSVVLDAPFSPHSDIFAVYRSISNLPSPPLAGHLSQRER